MYIMLRYIYIYVYVHIYIYTNIHKCAYRRCQSEIYSIDYSPATTDWNAYLSRRVFALLARRKIEHMH
jgi:hypothetical protein